MAVIVAEGDGDMPFTADLFGADVTDEIWFEKAMAALNRLGFSGLIYYREVGFDIRIVLRKLFLHIHERNWLNYYFIPTVLGEILAMKYLVYFDERNKPQVINNIDEDFRKDLERIFDEHGVGFDVDLSYEKLLSLDGK